MKNSLWRGRTLRADRRAPSGCYVPTRARFNAPIWLALIVALGGCTNNAIVMARSEIAAGNYASAHQELAQAVREPKLSARELQQVRDGLCLTEQKIGAPQYSLSQQHRTCAIAAAGANTSSGPVLAQIEEAERVELAQHATAAIRSGDFADAENAIERYQALPGADGQQVSIWSRELWAALDRDHSSSAEEKRALGPTISRLSHQYSQVEGMSIQSFRRWIESNVTISGTPLVSAIQINKHAVNLWIAGDQAGRAALNLDRFTRVNDAQIARCRCDGRTNIAMQGSGLPAYLVRLDPATHRSEILILLQAQARP